MKRSILTVIALTLGLIGAYSANAQTKREVREARFKENFPFRYEVSLGWGGYPILDDYLWGSGWGCQACKEMAAMHNSGHLSHLYRTVNGGEYMTGLISAEFNIHYSRRFTLSLEAGVNGIWGKSYNRLDGSLADKMHGAIVTLLPQAQFNWLNKKNIRLYSSFGLGATVGGYDNEFDAYVAAQLTPFGITAGHKVFFFAEQSIGTAYFGGKFGIGYRF